MAFPFFTIFFILVILLALRYHHNKNKQIEGLESFWENEHIANTTRAKDISNLPYLTIPLEKFPLHFTDDEDVAMLEEQFINLSQKKLLNLTSMTNTQLKENYGVVNLATMQNIGENFNELTILLVDYAKSLMERGMYQQTIPVLLYGVEIKSDISSTYTLLGDCYVQTNQSQEIPSLIASSEALPKLTRQTTINYLTNLLSLDEQQS